MRRDREKNKFIDIFPHKIYLSLNLLIIFIIFIFFGIYFLINFSEKRGE